MKPKLVVLSMLMPAPESTTSFGFMVSASLLFAKEGQLASGVAMNGVHRDPEPAPRSTTALLCGGRPGGPDVQARCSRYQSRAAAAVATWSRT